jgi:hypothetical protein
MKLFFIVDKNMKIISLILILILMPILCFGAASTQIEYNNGTSQVITSSANPLPVGGTVTANAGTGSFTVAQSTAANLNATVTGAVAITPAFTPTNATGSGTATGTAANILSSNSSRKFLMITNTGAATIYLDFKTTATTSSWPLLPGVTLTLATQVPNGAISAITGGTSVTYYVLEG